MFSLAFAAFLRIGEVTISNQKVANPHVIQLSQITIHPESADFVITFISYKHKANTLPFRLHISASGSKFSVVRLLADYLSHRGFKPGPLFCYRSGKSITRSHFTTMLKSCLSASGIKQNIKCHSFRIGAATPAIASGFTNEQVQAMGRWKSDAFKNYIRIPSLNLYSL